MMATQSRTPMAPAANVNSIPHANAQQYSNQYNVPRSHEVYRLMDPQLEAAIPAEVREQFQRDDEGRLLWFTAAGRDRSALRGVAPEYAGLGHSVSHLAHIGDVREERRRKRKERDEALAREEEARKKAAGGRENGEEERLREQEKNALVERALLGLAQQIDQGTKVIEEGLGGWREEKRLWEEERKAARAQGKE
jgi:chromatin structure-remodeling complex subunit RSC1/2